MYLGRSRNHRVDRIIYILAEKVELDFRRDAYQIRHGIKPIWLSTKERTRKKLAYDLSEEDARNMVTINGNMIECKSFTTSTTYYLLSLQQYGPAEFTIVSCTCPDFNLSHIICKHMFLVNRINQIPIQTHALKYNPIAPIPPQQYIDRNTNQELQQLLSQALDRCYNHVTKKKSKVNNEQLEQMILLLNNTHSNLEKITDPHKRPDKQH